MSLSTFILFAWFMTPYFYLVDHMTANGYEESKASLVLSVIGVANTIGMVNTCNYFLINVLKILLDWFWMVRRQILG